MADVFSGGIRRVLDVCLLVDDKDMTERIHAMLDASQFAAEIRTQSVVTQAELVDALSKNDFDFLIFLSSSSQIGEGNFAIQNSVDATGEDLVLCICPLFEMNGRQLESRGDIKKIEVYTIPLPLVGDNLITLMGDIADRARRLSHKPLLVNFHNTLRSLLPSSIVYAESDRRVLYIHLEQEVLRVYGKLVDLLSLLPASFVQCHKSFIVNMDYIQEFDSGSVLMSNGDRVPISQKRRRSTRLSFEAHIGRQF